MVKCAYNSYLGFPAEFRGTEFRLNFSPEFYSLLNLKLLPINLQWFSESETATIKWFSESETATIKWFSVPITHTVK